VVAGLEEVNPFVSDEVNEPVLLRDTARPGARRQVLEGLGLSNSRGGISQNIIDEAHHTESRLSVGSNPNLQILEEF